MGGVKDKNYFSTLEVKISYNFYEFHTIAPIIEIDLTYRFTVARDGAISSSANVVRRAMSLRHGMAWYRTAQYGT